MPDYAFPVITAELQSVTTDTAQTRADKVNAVLSKIQATEINSFDSVYAPASTSSQNVLTYAMVLNRNNTIQDIASDLTTENKAKLTGRDTFTRQAEINEWEAQNKMDTLFFLQILFLYLTTLVITFYLRQIGLFPSTIVYILAGVGLLIVGLVLWNRASYTSSTRDKRYWNRRYIGLGDANLQAQIQCNISS
jgi:hypothetical protein